MNHPAVVQAKNLVKKYGEKNVVDGISFDVYKGECFGLLGLNGSGKSTTLQMLYCSALVTSGELYVLDLNVKKNFREIKPRIGVVTQESGLDNDLNVLENLIVYAGYHDIPRAEALERAKTLLRFMRLDEDADRPVDSLSPGFKRRLAIARGLVNQPELLIMDEPTAGLDVKSREWIWQFIQEMRQEDSTIIVATRYMEDVENVCDRIAIFDEGKILGVGAPQDLIQEVIGKEVVEFDTNNVDLNYYLNRLKSAGFAYQVIKNTVQILIKDDQEGRKAIELVASDRITLRRPSLNDVFLKLSGRELRDEP